MMRIIRAQQTPLSEILIRNRACEDVSDAVRAILERVRCEGDGALRDFARRFDGGAPAAFEVTRAEIERAAERVDPAMLAILYEAKANIEAFHRRQIRSGFVMSERPGTVIGQKITPLRRVGVYVPGGTAAYPSTVLMDVIPAKLAGVPEIVMTTPAKGGEIADLLLAAAHVAGVDRVFRIGGAQAVAALAYGTESVPRVDKIVGPGNAYVAEAKRQVYGLVDIDMIAGPSEILVIADAGSDPEHLAADLLSQAEHDQNASAVLITDSEELAFKAQAAVERQLESLPRQGIARASVDANGKILLVDSIEEAVDLANELAPEHLELCVDNPFDYLGRVRNAGSIFLGRSCPEALGDYFAGPNHTLPTGGTARFSSPLSVDDFIKKSAFTYYTPEALEAVADKVAAFARAEGLEAHARSATIRGRQKL